MKAILCATAVTAAFMFTACNNPNSARNDGFSRNDSPTVSGDTSGSTKIDTSRSSMMTNDSSNTMSSVTTASTINDKGVIEFVQKAAGGSMMEIELGNIAQKNAQSARIKNYAAMIVTDHSAAGSELRSMAALNNIMIPAGMPAEHQKHIDMMKAKTGAGFDMAYIDMMVTDHKKDIAAFRKASTELGDAAYKEYAAKTLPTLQKHLDSAMAIRKGM